MKYLPLIAAAAMFPLTTPAFADTDSDKAMTAEVLSNDGITGTVSVTPEASGVMVVKIDLQGVPEGEHGVHIHETGDCSAANFQSAGGHLADDKDHGVMVEDGPHPGDLPNAMVGEDGVLNVTYFNNDLTTDLLKDDDGSAFVVHSDADDYTSQPAGDAGSRIACAVLAAPKS